MASSGLVISEVQGVTVVSLRSASIIDQPSVESITKELYALVDEQARRKIIVDLSAVRFLSSQMLGVFVALQKKAKAIDGRAILAGLRPELMKVFKITRLEKILEFAADEREALRKLDILGLA